MGAGIARAIREHFSEAYDADAATLPGDASKLGAYSVACCIRGSSIIAIINADTQLHPSGLGVLVDYQAGRRSMRALKHNFPGKRIGYPKIGASLAWGDWKIISQIINEELAGEGHTLVENVVSCTHTYSFSIFASTSAALVRSFLISSFGIFSRRRYPIPIRGFFSSFSLLRIKKSQYNVLKGQPRSPNFSL